MAQKQQGAFGEGADEASVEKKKERTTKAAGESGRKKRSPKEAVTSAAEEIPEVSKVPEAPEPTVLRQPWEEDRTCVPYPLTLSLWQRIWAQRVYVALALLIVLFLGIVACVLHARKQEEVAFHMHTAKTNPILPATSEWTKKAEVPKKVVAQSEPVVDVVRPTPVPEKIRERVVTTAPLEPMPVERQERQARQDQARQDIVELGGVVLDLDKRVVGLTKSVEEIGRSVTALRREEKKTVAQKEPERAKSEQKTVRPSDARASIRDWKVMGFAAERAFIQDKTGAHFVRAGQQLNGIFILEVHPSTGLVKTSEGTLRAAR